MSPILAAELRLPTLRHRLSLFGGSMDVQSAPGAGTRVTLTMPVFREGVRVGEAPGK